VAHSRSPQIHHLFAEQTREPVQYEKILAPLDDFPATVRAWRQSGGRGANITVPFKLQALALADRVGRLAQVAGAANVLRFDRHGITADNTDGIGLVRDIEDRLGVDIAGQTIMIVGAGGAARGVLEPLLEAGASSIHIANRTAARAQALIADMPGDMRQRLSAGSLLDLPQGSTVVINASSAGLSSDLSPLGADALGGVHLAYDMVYGALPSPFMHAARRAAVPVISDGLGMLVEQAAESFLIWRGVRPETAPVYQALRHDLTQSRKDDNA
jgi:shikimate dehydrogenase